MAEKLLFMRSNYNLGVCPNATEVSTGKDMCDPSEYVPTEELLRRFIRGEAVPHNTRELDYDSVDDIDSLSDDKDDKIFNEHAEQENLKADIINMGENEVKARVNKIRQKVSKQRVLKKDPPKDVLKSEGIGGLPPKATGSQG